jgi:3-hydroxyisobutyrate dehydrogenase-like beta-hydroxyacid dehydrogenase
MGQHVVHVGRDVGRGQAAKYCLNLAQAVVLEGVLEGYALAASLGVPLPKLAEIFEHSAGRTGVGAFKTPYLFRGDFEAHFRLDLMHKDLRLALARAAAAAVELPLAQRVEQLYEAAEAAGLGAEDFLATAKMLEQRSGRSLRHGAGGEA